MRTLHLADANARDAFVRFVSVKEQPPPQKVVNGRPVSMRRFLAAGEANTHLDSSREVLRLAPDVVEILLDPFGQEKERRSPEDRLPNVSEDVPVRFTKNRIKRLDAVRRFAFTRTLQLWHSDGLTYEFLHGIAAELDEADEMVLLGAGEKSRDPLVLQLNGLPWRAFLEGRVSDNGYCLLLRLSNLELKQPPARS